MRNYLGKLREQMFGEQFQRFLKEAYDTDVNRIEDGGGERQYAEACTWFEKNWNREQNERLHCIEQLQEKKRDYAGEYAFCCGMSVAFEQLFTENKDLQFDYFKRLGRGLYEVNGMKRHPYYYNWASQVRKIYDSLEMPKTEPTEESFVSPNTGASDPAQEHLISHECGWDQRICSGSAAAYYLGYRVALNVIDRVRPMAVQNMMDQILVMEYQLGITLSAAERERMKGAEESCGQGKAG